MYLSRQLLTATYAPRTNDFCSLPVKKGGLAIPIFLAVADLEFANRLPCNYWKAGWTHQQSRYIAQHHWKGKSSRSTSRRKIAHTREELNNTILQQLIEKMSPEQLRENYLAKMKGALSWLTTLPLSQRTSTWTKGNSTMCSAGHWRTSHIDVLAARDSTLIMQCRV